MARATRTTKTARGDSGFRQGHRRASTRMLMKMNANFLLEREREREELRQPHLGEHSRTNRKRERERGILSLALSRNSGSRGTRGNTEWEMSRGIQRNGKVRPPPTTRPRTRRDDGRRADDHDQVGLLQDDLERGLANSGPFFNSRTEMSCVFKKG